MWWVPTDRLDVVVFAWCNEPLTVAVPRTVVPSLKVTVPVGLPVTEGLTVAVKVTAVPWLAGFTEDLRVVVVDALFTFSVTTVEVLGENFALPL